VKDLLYRLQFAALRLVLALVRPLPLAARQRAVGAAAAALVTLAPPLMRRATDNLALVRPDMAPRARRRLARRVARNAGATLTTIWFNPDFAATLGEVEAEGPGLAAIRTARAEGRPALLVSGHFGRWEAIRHVLRREGLEVGAIYRPNNNPYYEPLFRGGIEAGGRPIVPKGRAGNRQMLRHLRDGGIMAILPDQAVSAGVDLDFLGHPARTSLAAAELARRYDAPLVPAFAPVEDGAEGERVRVILEAPIPPGPPEEMMAAFNARLGAWVERHPEQWHWFHRRWKPKGPARGEG
jgi:KDO2-lipid IV(A) lauroyltransferase